MKKQKDFVKDKDFILGRKRTLVVKEKQKIDIKENQKN